MKYTTGHIAALMGKLEAENKGDRENSLYASVELSLRRLPDDVRLMVNRLMVVHGGITFGVMIMLLDGDQEMAQRVASGLLDCGLAELLDYNYLRLDPALPAYLRVGMAQEEFAQLETAWAEAMLQLVNFLYMQLSKDSLMALNLTLLELPNLLALLDWLSDLLEIDHPSAETVSDTAGKIEQLLAPLNRPSALAKAVKLREESAGRIPEWGKTRFDNERLLIERLLAAGQFQPAYEKAGALLEKAKGAVYQGADYDLGFVHFLLGRVLEMGGQAAAALDMLIEARRLFEAVGEQGERMVTVTLTEQADCLSDLGRLDEATANYQEAIVKSERLQDFRQVAVGKVQLATVRMMQKKFAEALAEYRGALAIFEKQDEPKSVATIWHQIGMVHQEAGDYESAEAAYRRSLEFEAQYSNKIGQASSLGQLGNLYASKLNRLEEAITFYRQAADRYVELGDLRHEGVVRNNIANTLRQLKRYDEARAEIMRAIECDKPFGHAAEPWKTFAVLSEIEEATSNPAGAHAAWAQARDAYLAYRQQGGTPLSQGGVLFEQLLPALQQGDSDETLKELEQLSLDTSTAEFLKPLIRKLISIANSSRNPAFTIPSAIAIEDSFSYIDAAELLLISKQLLGGKR